MPPKKGPQAAEGAAGSSRPIAVEVCLAVMKQDMKRSSQSSTMKRANVPAGCVTMTENLAYALDGFGVSPKRLKQGLTDAEVKMVFKKGVPLGKSFLAAHNGQYNAPGYIIDFMQQNGEQVNVRELTKIAGMAACMKYLKPDALVKDASKLLHEYDVPLEQVKEMSGSAMKKLLSLCRVGGGLEGAQKLLQEKTALDEAEAPELSSIADDELPGSV